MTLEDFGLALIGLVVVLIVLFLGIKIPAGMVSNQYYKAHVESYFRLADQSSDAKDKLEYLNEYKDALAKEELCEGQARYFFQTPYTDLSRQCRVLDSLIARLESLGGMKPDSLEYQQAMRQVTTDEFAGFDTCVFVSGWNHKSVVRYIFAGAESCQSGVTASTND